MFRLTPMRVAILIWYAVLLGSLLGVYSRLPLYGLPLHAAALVAAALIAIAEPPRLEAAPLRLAAWGGAALLVVAAVGVAVSVSPGDSLLQLSQWAGYAAMAYVGVAIARRSEPRPVAEFLLLIGTLSCGIALYFYWGELGNMSQAAMLGSFGNKNHLAGLLLLALPLALALLVAADRRREQLAYGACCLFMGAVFVLTYSRGAYVALAPAVLLVGLWAWRRRRLRAALGRGLLLAALIVAQVSLMRGASLGYAVGRSTDVVAATAAAVAGAAATDTLAPRLNYWQGAWRIAADYPLLGVGPGAFYVVFPEYQDDARYFSKFAHNLPLQVGAEMGLLGLLAAAAVAVGVTWGARRAAATPVVVGLAASLLAGALHNLVELDWYLPALGNLAAAEAGLLVGVGGGMSLARRRGRWRWLVSGVAAALALATLVQWGSALALERGREAEGRGDIAAAQTAYAVARRLNPLNAEPAFRLGELCLEAVEAGADGVAVAAGVAYAGEAVGLSPRNVAYRALLAQIYFHDSDQSSQRRAAAQLEAVVARRRSYLVPYAYSRLGNAYLALGETAAAERVFRGLLAGFPDGPDSPQPEYGALPREETTRLLAETHLALGRIAVGNGDMTAAAASFVAAADLRPADPEPQFQLGALALATGRPQAAVPHLERAVALAPGDGVSYLYLGLAYAEVGRCDDARRSLEAAVAIAPSAPVPTARLNALCGGVR